MEENNSSENANAARTAAVLTSQLMSDPNVLAAFTQELGSMVGKSSGYIESLPKSVKRRIKALKKLQVELFELEAQFYTEIHNLECKYSQLYAPVLNKRRDIINGNLEPADDDCDWDSDEDDSEELPQKTESTESTNSVIACEEPALTDNGAKQLDNATEETKGVPEFWLTIFKNVEELSALVQEHDEPVLQYLQDVRINYLSSDNMGFQVEFAFAPNDYFTNTVLTKEYHLRCKPEEQNCLNYEGPEIIKCTGCVIDWKPGKNVTEKIVKQKCKRPNKKVIKKTVKVDSFFNFFSPPQATKDAAENEEVEGQLMEDFGIGRLLQERIVPRAVLYFTGEALDDDDDDDDDEEEDNEEEETGDNYDEGEDPDYEPPQGLKDGPPNCQQQ